LAGSSAWSRDPELYQKTSSIEPVDSFVLTRLSPSVPPGWISVLTVTPGFAFWKASTTDFAALMVAAVLSMNRLIVLPPFEPPPPPELLVPPRPELQAVMVINAPTATPAVASLRPAIFIGEPPERRGWEIRT
jgi:hypothetical protein